VVDARRFTHGYVDDDGSRTRSFRQGADRRDPLANSRAGVCATPTPAGFRMLLVYIAEGAASAESIRDVDAVLAFQRDVMGRDAAAVAAYIEEARTWVSG
jgi:hypothetical protein